MTAVFANVTNQVAGLKELYTGDDYMKDLVYAKNPLYALLPKDESPEGFAGKYIPVPTVFGTPQGRSHTFANAQGNQTPVQEVSFFVYRVSDYEVVSITNELLEATKGNAGAFIDQGKLMMDTGFRNISNNIAQEIYRSGTGSRGAIGTITLSGANNTVSCTLSDANAIVQFEVGMVLVASLTDGGAVSTDTVTITGVSRSKGTWKGTSSTTLSNSLSVNWAAASFLTVQGDIPAAGATGTGSYLAISGLAAWLPITEPTTGDSFWNVDRSVDPTRLAGVRFDGSSESIEEALIDGGALTAREGGQPSYAFINFASWAALEKSLGSKVQYVSVKHDTAEIAFKGIEINMPYGPCTVLPDRNCPSKTAYLLSLENWKFRSLGRSPHILTYGMEGLEGLRVGNADAVEVRIGYYGNLVCNAPGWNCVIQLSS